MRKSESARGSERLAKQWEEPKEKRSRTPLVVLAIVILLLGALSALQLSRAIPPPKAVAASARTIVVGQGAPSMPWPQAGQAALAVSGVGTFSQGGSQTPVPIASVAKMMTALVILSDHPLGVAQPGPSITVTPSDVALYQSQLAQGDSVSAVASGEVLSERQALQALLIPSADNVAVMLARWDAGSNSAFVAKMNTMATKMGLRHTHYADTSGLDPATASTAADQLVVEQRAVANRTIAHITALAQATLPVAGVVYNVNSLLGQDGIFGIKTGSDPQAGGCFAFAAQVPVAGQNRTVYGVVLGQQGTFTVGILKAAFDASVALIKGAEKNIHTIQVLPPGVAAGSVTSAWSHPIAAKTSSSLEMLGAAGMVVSIKDLPATLNSKGVASGAQVGKVVASSGNQVVQLPAKSTSAMAKPGLLWRLSRP